jgi:hypothetical protein
VIDTPTRYRTETGDYRHAKPKPTFRLVGQSQKFFDVGLHIADLTLKQINLGYKLTVLDGIYI